MALFCYSKQIFRRKACQKKESHEEFGLFFDDEKREKNKNKVGHYPVMSACQPYARAISPSDCFECEAHFRRVKLRVSITAHFLTGFK